MSDLSLDLKWEEEKSQNEMKISQKKELTHRGSDIIFSEAAFNQ